MCFMSKKSSSAPPPPTPAHDGPTVRAEEAPKTKRREGQTNPSMKRTLLGDGTGGSRERRRGTLLGTATPLDQTAGKSLLGA